MLKHPFEHLFTALHRVQDTALPRFLSPTSCQYLHRPGTYPPGNKQRPASRPRGAVSSQTDKTARGTSALPITPPGTLGDMGE
jgi:hypothetical protein